VHLPELVKRNAEQLLDNYCAEQSSCHCCSQRVRLVYRLRGDKVTLFMRQRKGTGGLSATAIACFRYSAELQQWTLHYLGTDRKWRLYLNAAPTLNLRKLITSLDEDPLGFFWGARNS
jgi:hypothetical protein